MHCTFRLTRALPLLLACATCGTDAPLPEAESVPAEPDPVPYLVRDIQPGPGGSRRSSSGLNRPGVELNGVLFFSADDGVHGEELWKTDGTTEGTVLVKDIWPGPDASFPWMDEAQVFRGALYFTAEDGEHGRELWRTDGTPDGTYMLRDTCPGGCRGGGGRRGERGSEWQGKGGLVEAFGSLYFGGHYTAGSNGVGLAALWKTDGTTAGTELVTATFGGERHSRVVPFAFLAGGVIFYAAPPQCDTCTAAGSEIWRTEGTPESTVRIHETLPGWTRLHLGMLRGAFYMLVDDHLFRVDGTAEGTGEVTEVPRWNDDPYVSATLNDRFYFSRAGRFWRSDGTALGTYAFLPYYYARLEVVNDMLFTTWQGSEKMGGHELWRTDGTKSGTALVKDIRPGRDDSFPRFLGHRNDVLYFHADDGQGGAQLWRSDGTNKGTRLVTNLIPPALCNSSVDCHISPMATIGSRIYVDFDDGVHGLELWALQFP